MPESVVNERSTFWWQVAFLGRNSSAVTPATVAYRVHDAINGAVLSTGTVTPATTVDILIGSTLNAIRHNKPYERRRINVTATFTTGQQTQEQSWLVKNLGFTGTVAT